MIPIFLLLLTLLFPPAAPLEPPLAIDSAAFAADLNRGDHFLLNVAIFSSDPLTTTVTFDQALDPARLAILAMSADNGTLTASPFAIHWEGAVRLDRPVTVSIQLGVVGAAPAGLVTLPGVARDAHGHVARDSVTLRICCIVTLPTHLRLPLMRAT